MTSRFTAAERKKIIETYKDERFRHPLLVSIELGWVSASTVDYLVKQAGIQNDDKEFPRKVFRPTHPKEIKQKALEALRQSSSPCLKDIAKDFGISISTACHYAQKAGIPIPHKCRKKDWARASAKAELALK